MLTDTDKKSQVDGIAFFFSNSEYGPITYTQVKLKLFILNFFKQIKLNDINSLVPSRSWGLSFVLSNFTEIYATNVCIYTLCIWVHRYMRISIANLILVPSYFVFLIFQILLAGTCVMVYEHTVYRAS